MLNPPVLAHCCGVALCGVALCGVVSCLPRPLSASILRPAVDLLAQYRTSLAGDTVASSSEAETTMFAGFLKDASFLASEAARASSLAMSMSIGVDRANDAHSALSSR